MKKTGHPKYNHQTKVICACGNTFTTGSTEEEIRVEICSACHPFFTGEEKFIDTLGRVERFKQRQQQSAGYVSKKTKKKQEQEKRAKEESKKPQTLKEMLSQ